MKITTTRCSEFGHQEFVLEADESRVLVSDIEKIASSIERMIADGETFEPGETFQVGWGLTMVKSAGQRLTLVEPDFEDIPIEWTPGITETLRQMAVQLLMLDSVGLREEMDMPTGGQTVVVCNRYSEPNFEMSRWPGNHENDSGWMIACMNDDHDHATRDNLDMISLYEAYLNQRALLGFAAFPVGSRVVVDLKNGLKITKDDKELAIEQGSAAETWYKMQTER